MRPVEQLYKIFCARMAQLLEGEANAYARHPALQDADQQIIRSLRENCRQWKHQIEKLDRAYSSRRLDPS